MDRHADVRTVKRIEAEYSPATEKFELEDWLAQQLFETYHNINEDIPELFRFRDAVLLYAPETELINATMLVGNNVTEHCVLLSSFLYKNYGVKKLANKADVEMALMLSEHDFELMALQITDDLIAWYQNMHLVKEVLEMRTVGQDS
jgi:hypothetical protein